MVKNEPMQKKQWGGKNDYMKKLMERNQSGTRTLVQYSQESGRKNWASRSSARSLAHTAHSFACSALIVLLPRSAAPTWSLAPLSHSISS